MLIKMMSRPLSRPALHQLMRYINEGRESFENEPHFILRYNTSGNTTKEIADDFTHNNSFIRRGKGKRNGVVHIVMSWHKKEQKLIDDSMLSDFGRKFAELINCENSLIFCRPHYDKEAIHLHIAQSASLLNSGKSTRISKARLKEIQIEMNEYQREHYPQLKHSLLYLPDLERTKESSLGIPLPESIRETDGSIRAKMRGKVSQLETVRNQLLAIAKKYPQKQDFIKAINNEKTLSVYYRRGSDTPTGIITSTNKKFRFKRLSLNIENLTRDVRLHELEKQQNRNRDNELNKSLER